MNDKQQDLIEEFENGIEFLSHEKRKEDLIRHWHFGADINDLQVMLTALQEKAEREKGCEYCQGAVGKKIPDIDNDGHAVIVKYETVTYHNVMLHVSPDNVDYSGQGENMYKISYCPMCGRKLESEVQNG